MQVSLPLTIQFDTAFTDELYNPLRYKSYRTCPNPSRIEEYLKQHTGYEGNIQENDKVCYTCYKSHLVILEKSRPPSTDSDLKQLVSDLSDHFPATPVGSVEEAIDRGITKVTIEVGKKLIERNVLLLPAVHDHLLNYVKQYVAKANLQDPDSTITQVITSRWILSCLTATLQHHITYACKIRKYGTLVYRPNTAFIGPLTRLLWQQRTHFHLIQ